MIFNGETLRNDFIFFTCIFPSYMSHEITKEFWKWKHILKIKANFENESKETDIAKSFEVFASIRNVDPMQREFEDIQNSFCMGFKQSYRLLIVIATYLTKIFSHELLSCAY